MNVLILTPDAVGSTLLQRTLTVYMQFYEFEKPVINLHELSNGLAKYYSPEFNQELLGKKEEIWGYYQTLPEVIELLESVDHYKTSRLAHYHIRRRKDSVEDQIPFYNYLNQNFYIIACKRKNVFEHALSWAINKVTKKLNVYSSGEKIESFLDLYKDKIHIDQENLLKSLDDYKSYISWCDHFEIGSYFEYEKDIPNLEQFIFDLPVFTNKEKIKSWKDVYGLTFNDWNKCHFYTGDIGAIALDKTKNYNSFIEHLRSPNETDKFLPWESEELASYYDVADDSWPKIDNPMQLHNLNENIKEEIEKVHNIRLPVMEKQESYALANHLPTHQLDFLVKHKKEYVDAVKSMEKMTELGIMISGPPMKKQTFAEKKLLVKNFEQCLTTFNQWALQNPEIASPLEQEEIKNACDAENIQWRQQSIKLSNLT